MMYNDDAMDKTSPKITWRFHLEDKSLQEEFSDFMTSTKFSNMAILITVSYWLFFFPLSCANLFSSVHIRSVIFELHGSVSVIVSLAIAVVGLLICYQGAYSTSPFGKSVNKFMPSINTILIVLVNIFDLLLLSQMAFPSDLCGGGNFLGNATWHCFSNDNASYPLLNFIPTTPLNLVIGLRETRIDLICGCNIIVYLFAAVVSIHKKNGKFLLQLTIWTIVNYVILFDVHLSRIEKFLQQRKLQRALDHIEEMKAIDREIELRHMIGNVAHDLKTPLSSIITAIEMIAETIEQLKPEVQASNEENIVLERVSQGLDFMKNCLRSAQNTTNFMFMTINRCIDYTKASKGIRLTPKLETINLLQALQVPLECMRNIQEKVQVVLRPLSEDICPYIITDKQWLQENLLCLLSNAVKYSGDGLVTIKICIEPYTDLEKKYLRSDKLGIAITPARKAGRRSSSMPDVDVMSLFGYAKINPSDALESFSAPSQSGNSSIVSPSIAPKGGDKYICYEVEDSGIGVSEEIMITLFNPFKQAQRLAGGTGLGLYSLAKRMDAIKGFYGVHQRKDGHQGSVFWFAVPYRADTVMATFVKEATACVYEETDRGALCTHNVVEAMESHFQQPPQFARTMSSALAIQQQQQQGGNNNNRKTTEMSMRESKKIDPSFLSATQPPPLLSATSRLSSVAQLSPASSKRKLLLVDDSPTIVRMMSMMLKRQGYEVIIAENGVLALEKVQSQWASSPSQSPTNSSRNNKNNNNATTETTVHNHDVEIISNEVNMQSSLEDAQENGFDLILMDMQMPVMDGIEATKRLRMLEEHAKRQHEEMINNPNNKKRRRSLIVIGMSANCDEETKKAAIAAGVNEFVAKPLSMEVCSQLFAKYL